MSVLQLFFDDEGVISRRTWWVGTLVLLFASMGIGWAATRIVAQPGLGEALAVFSAIAMLIPFHSVNAKRFRAIGRNPALALWGGLVPALSILVDLYLDWPSLDLLLGWMMIVILVWYVLDLGFYPHEDHASQARIDGVVNRA
jgi:uncharacterized membrane protein YhaH (DUF805 family)